MITTKPLKKILLKYSGEAVAGLAGQGIDPKILHFMSREIKTVVEQNVSVGLVIGGGNLFRGQELNQDGIDRVAGDHMGMLATVMNGIALRDSLERNGIKTRVMSAIPMPGIVEHYDRRRAIHLLDEGFVVIFTAGTGNPFFTTDSAAALRATELGAQIVIKGTKVNGIYDKDPEKYKDAEKYSSISFDKVLKDNLRVMDLTAITLCKENNLPIHVFDIKLTGALKKIILGEHIGTLVSY